MTVAIKAVTTERRWLVERRDGRWMECRVEPVRHPEHGVVLKRRRTLMARYFTRGNIRHASKRNTTQMIACETRWSNRWLRRVAAASDRGTGAALRGTLRGGSSYSDDTGQPQAKCCVHQHHATAKGSRAGSVLLLEHDAHQLGVVINSPYRHRRARRHPMGFVSVRKTSHHSSDIVARR